MTAPLLELDHVTHRYQCGAETVTAFLDATLSVGSGEVVALVGRSGSGKSTLLHLAGGLAVPDEGSVRVLGNDPSAMSTAQRALLRRRSVGFVFQFFHLLPTLTIAENVELPLLLDKAARSRAAARDALCAMELADKAERYPAELSGGEMQRVAVARSLVTGAPLILADEPTGNLDSATGGIVLDLLTSRVRESGAALLLATHDAAAASRADRTVALADGMITGTTL